MKQIKSYQCEYCGSVYYGEDAEKHAIQCEKDCLEEERETVISDILSDYKDAMDRTVEFAKKYSKEALIRVIQLMGEIAEKAQDEIELAMTMSYPSERKNSQEDVDTILKSLLEGDSH